MRSRSRSKQRRKGSGSSARALVPAPTGRVAPGASERSSACSRSSRRMTPRPTYAAASGCAPYDGQLRRRFCGQLTQILHAPRVTPGVRQRRAGAADFAAWLACTTWCSTVIVRRRSPASGPARSTGTTSRRTTTPRSSGCASIGIDDIEDDPSVLVEAPGVEPRLCFQLVPESKVVKNRVHLDLRCDDLEAETARLVELGARVLSTTGPSAGLGRARRSRRQRVLPLDLTSRGQAVEPGPSLPRAACAAARRAIGTRNGEHDT